MTQVYLLFVPTREEVFRLVPTIHFTLKESIKRVHSELECDALSSLDTMCKRFAIRPQSDAKDVVQSHRQ